MVAALAGLFTDLGGELRQGCPVRAIEVVGCADRLEHRITSRDGTRERFDLTVSNTDLHDTCSVRMA